MIEFPNLPAIAEFDPQGNEIAVDVEQALDVTEEKSGL
jgi:hypothetical protein